ncbi:MAG: EAL domain-containing protein [Acetatifactor sp.]|nr:EAL domain-containing protein [Acetatifactor sp.]
MMDDVDKRSYDRRFVEEMPAAAFVCRAQGGRELLYANQNMIRLYECETYEEFMEFVGGCFDGMVSSAQFKSMLKELELQIREKGQNTGRLFYHVTTKKGNVYLAEEHWLLKEDPVEGQIVYGFVISREYDLGGADYDPITGLYGKMRFQGYAMDFNREMIGKTSEEYVISYLNLINFKLLNVNKGIAEGDDCLTAVADALGHVFEDAFLARLSDDHFGIVDKREGHVERLERFGNYFKERYGDRFGVVGKWGVYPFVPNKDFDIEKALSYAKIACDYIKYHSGVTWTIYSETLAQKRNTAEHLSRTFEEALEKGWIKVYYQPVIRSITNQLCGVESLVRWQDPQFGFIFPGDFIGVLEESRQIHKLDSFVVEEVCRTMHERVLNHQPIVPVSVNFSRLDFVTCDMLAVVESAVKKYDVPRDYIHVEITESMIVSDQELMRGVINSFRAAGYEIWMDDFGSGYSSLTVLKDYQFDMLKLDMNFLSNFTDKSKDIMRSAIIMAKDLGIKTLAEGVETKEHLDYLKSIGCEEIQGYYYGKPEPAEVMFAHLAEKNVSIEHRKWRHFYEVAGFSVKATDVPLEIVEADEKGFKTLFMNKAYREQVFGDNVDFTLEEIDRRIYHTASPLQIKYQEFLEQIKRTGKPETFYYTNGDSYMCLRAQVLVQNEDRCVFKASLYNVSADPDADKRNLLDSKLRTLNLLFRVVLLGDLKNHTLMPLLGTSPNMKESRKATESVEMDNELFAEQNIFPTEKKRYRSFMDFSTLRERVEKSMFGYISDVFRIKQQDGAYRMGEISLMLIPGTNGQEFLYCAKPYFDMRGKENRDADEQFAGGKFAGSPYGDGLFPANEKSALEDAGAQDNYARLIWENMLWDAGIKFFWKDTERRYLGVSQAFLDYFGIQSMDEVVGKTDEELRWFVNEAPARSDDLLVLQKGVRISDKPHQCIAKGGLRIVLATKMPIHNRGLIVGLVGYIVDREMKLADLQIGLGALKKDPVTGLDDAHSFADALIDYAVQYHDRERNYGVILLRNEKHARIVDTYGEQFANQVLSQMGKVIISVAGQNCVVARVKGSIFAILTSLGEDAEAVRLKDELQGKLSGMNSVEGNPITMRINSAMNIRTWEGVTDENIYDSALREVLEEKD